jgi:hypothetical protein
LGKARFGSRGSGLGPGQTSGAVRDIAIRKIGSASHGEFGTPSSRQPSRGYTKIGPLSSRGTVGFDIAYSGRKKIGESHVVAYGMTKREARATFGPPKMHPKGCMCPFHGGHKKTRPGEKGIGKAGLNLDRGYVFGSHKFLSDKRAGL